MTFIKTKTSLILACALSLVALPAAFADQHAGKNSSDAMFKAMDSNRDGKVSRAEHAASAQKMFSEADANRDGRTNLVEMEAAHAKLQAEHAKLKTDMPAKGDKPMRMEMSAAEMLKQCDQNGDGQVSTAEHAAHADAMFTKMDTDSDGFLCAAECVAGHEAMKKDTKSAKK
jgi:Ca2+-binding EF-hand superfamily protein